MEDKVIEMELNVINLQHYLSTPSEIQDTTEDYLCQCYLHTESLLR